MRKWIPLVLVAAAALGSATLYDRLPGRATVDLSQLLPMVPAATETMPRGGIAFGLPLLALLLWALLHEAPVGRLGRAAYRLFPGSDAAPLSPAGFEKFAPAYRLIVLWVVGLILAMHVAVLALALGWPVAPGRIVGIVFAAGLLGVGNVLPRLRPNTVAGIRTARTLADPALWAQVHRRYGALWLGGGVIVLIVALAAPRYALVAGVAVLLLTSVAALAAPRTLAVVGVLGVAGWLGVPTEGRAAPRAVHPPSAPAERESLRWARVTDTLPPADVRETAMTLAVAGGLQLRATLTVPVARVVAKVPVVLIVAGSGPTDRQGNSVGQPVQPYLYARLAWALAQRGVASVRYDKRALGLVQPNLDPRTLTLEAYRDDVVAAARQLRRDPRFGRLVLLGHSEGAGLVLQACNAGAPADAIVMMSGAGRPLVALLRDQFRVQYDSVTSAKAESSFVAYLRGESPGEVPDNVRPLVLPQYLPMLRSMAAYDPPAELVRVRVPVLLVHGGMDLQVTDADFAALVAAHPPAARLLIPAANHVYKPVAARTMAAQMRSYTDPMLDLVPELAPGIATWVGTLDNASRRKR